MTSAPRPVSSLGAKMAAPPVGDAEAADPEAVLEADALLSEAEAEALAEAGGC